MGHFIASMYLFIYNSMYSLDGIQKILTTYSNAISDTLADGGPMHAVYVQLRIVALGMLAVYFIISFGTRMAGRETSQKIIFTTLIQYFVGFALAMYSFEIVKLLFWLGDSMTSLLTKNTASVTSLSSYATAFEESIKDIGLMKEVHYLFNGLIPYAACLVTDVAIIYVVVTRVLRICVCAAASPIAIANCFEGSRRSDAARFLKKTFAMSLQCSVIMLIVLAVTNIAGYMTSGDVYSDAEQASQTVEEAKKEMISSQKRNNSKLRKDIASAVDKLGFSAFESTGYVLKSNIHEAERKLSKPNKITKDMEEQYKKYESDIGIQIFQRTSNKANASYKYSKKGYAKVLNKYKTFEKDKTIAFMDTLIGGPKLIYFLLLCMIKIGLIKQSMSLCNTIVGV